MQPIIKRSLNKMKRDLIIIGGGIAAHTAALYASRASLKPLVLSGSRAELDQLSLTGVVENYPGFPEGVKGPKLIEDCKKQAQKFGAEYIYDKIKSIKKNKSGFEITGNKKYTAKAVIISTGASPRRLGIKGEKEYWGKGVSACATCDAPLYKNKTAVVIGGGDSAMEESLALIKFTKKVYLIHRRDKFRASKIMQSRVMKQKGKIEIIFDTEAVEVLGDKLVTSLKVKNRKTGKEKKIKTDGVFYAIGHIPNTSMVKGVVKLDKMGYITTDKFGKTNVDGLYAAGDVQDPVFKQAITSAGTGCMAALNSEKFILEGSDKFKYSR